MYENFNINDRIKCFIDSCTSDLSERFSAIDETAEYNQLKVISAMQNCRVSEACFSGSTGYGYDDIGRDTLERVYAEIFRAEAALVRPQITCGTHALALALMANLRPGDEILSPVGRVYDTLEEVIGIRESAGSLAEYGITYDEVSLREDFSFDFPSIERHIKDETRLIEIQRSRGYSTRPSLTVERIEELIRFIRGVKPDVIILVDNCYGEFIERMEPIEAGADLVVGSLIKNPGGGLAPTGGYIAGKESCVEQAKRRLTAPGLGGEVGASLDVMRSLYQGLFFAPTVSASALKGAVLASDVFSKAGFKVSPTVEEKRTDIIQSVEFRTPEGLTAFCEGIQAAAPVDGFVVPEPWDMPGYDDKVIMAAGAFIAGSSIELSADGPLREPYAAYFQGGLTWPHAKLGVTMALQKLYDGNLVSDHLM